MTAKFEVGQVVIVTKTPDCLYPYFNVGDKALVLEVYGQGVRLDFNGFDNPEVYGNGKWVCGTVGEPDTACKLYKPKQETKQEVKEMKTENVAYVTRKFLVNKLKAHSTRFFSVEFQKKNGKIHFMNCRKFVSKWAKNKVTMRQERALQRTIYNQYGLLPVWERQGFGKSPQAAGYRFINLDGVTRAIVDGLTYYVID